MSAEAPPVVIVGAGAAGATLALLLASRGLATTVLERRREPFAHPAAHVISSRSQEIWHSASPELAARIAAMAAGPEEVRTIRWCGRLDGPPLGEIDLFQNPELVERVRSHSPFLVSHIGQHLLMPVLWEALEAEPLVDLRLGHEVVDVESGADRAVTVVRTPSGNTERLTSRFVVDAEGASSGIRERAGIDMVGPVLAHMGSAFFHAPDLHPSGTVRPLLTWIYEPTFCGVLISHADADYVLMTAYLHPDQPIASDSRRYWERTLPRVLGAAAGTPTIHSTSRWTMTTQMAERFREGRVFLVGDAAHRFPHTGGFGLNSGVQDAHNLAWKLAAVLAGRAQDSLLDTYEAERRPVVERFARQSEANHFLLDDLGRHLGVTNSSLQMATAAFGKPPLSRLPGSAAARLAEVMTRAQLARTGALTSTSRRGRRLQQRVAGLVPGQAEHFVSTGLELGYAYDGPLTASEGTPQPVGLDEVMFYRPTTWPGARLPHTVVQHEGRAQPVHDLLDPDGLTLLTGAAGAWRRAVADRALHGGAWPVVVVAVEPETPEECDALTALLEVGVDGAVLVRPDGHVVWRTTAPAVVGAEVLHEVVRERWGPFALPAGPTPEGRAGGQPVLPRRRVSKGGA